MNWKLAILSMICFPLLLSASMIALPAPAEATPDSAEILRLQSENERLRQRLLDLTGPRLNARNLVALCRPSDPTAPA